MVGCNPDHEFEWVIRWTAIGDDGRDRGERTAPDWKDTKQDDA